MRFYTSAATIAATPEAIWAVLTDGASYSNWDSGVIRVGGRIAPGETIRVFSAVSPERAFPVKVEDFAPGKSMRWVGGMPLGLFKGERTFTLTPGADGQSTRFTLREEYTGPLLPLMWRSMPDLQPSFDQFAAGLKARVEG